MKTLSTLLTALLLLTAVSLSARQAAPQQGGDTVTFTFAPGKDLFTLRGNEAELERFASLIDDYRTEITHGRMPLRVDGYCTSLPTRAENLRTAYLRASRVKSELITQKGLREEDFITANYATAYADGRKDVVVVTLRLPAKDATKQQPESVAEQPRKEIPAIEDDEPDIKEEKLPGQETTPAPDAGPSPSPQTSAPAKPYCLALRTNLVYDALLLPTLGIEWRVNSHIGIKLDGSLSRWGGATGKVQKVWLLNPEVRWYLLRNRRFYAGVSGNYGEYNLYKYALGSIVSKDSGYQGKLWNAGLTAGYQLCLSRGFSLDFNLGLGYTRSEYDTFGMTNGVRVYKERNKRKNFWGPTQAGVSLVWTIGTNK